MLRSDVLVAGTALENETKERCWRSASVAAGAHASKWSPQFAHTEGRPRRTDFDGKWPPVRVHIKAGTDRRAH